MEFRTRVESPCKVISLGYDDNMLLMGSCFAENFGSFLAKSKFTCCTNPFGVLYNPLSVAEALQQLYDGKQYGIDDLFLDDNGIWHSWMHHSSFSSAHAEDTLRLIRQHAGEADIYQRNVLIITFGTAWVYERDGRIVGNCHKMPESTFTRRMLSTDEIVARWEALPCLQQGDTRVVFTVSPIRHQRDGFHANQLSKATLLLAVEELVRRHSHCTYFPSYEILMDELRDYRFYADDMLHPSSLAVQYVLERFQDTCLDTRARQILAQWESIQKLLAHRPLNPQALSWKHFLGQTIQKLHHFHEEYPFIHVENEINQCQELLNQSARR
ncbi:MAG: GSCFA domain-containing protein [Bacteroidales bacterium]|nr:GSCFA domain-containing protein [Bacteroidales bacterium]